MTRTGDDDAMLVARLVPAAVTANAEGTGTRSDAHGSAPRDTRRVLVIGAAGQIGFALVAEYRAAGYTVVGTHREHAFANERTLPFDLETAASDPRAAEVLLAETSPAVVIICAAFTWVDGAEEQPERLHAVNVAGPVAVAIAAKQIGAKTVAYSSEYVWDGGDGPYSEGDPVRAVNAYGQSKIDMEARLLEVDPSVLILRTTVVYGPERQGKNFVYQLCRKLRAEERVRVITDQISSPTYNRDLALLTRMLVEAGALGVFNACGEEVLDRHSFAVAVAEALGLDTSRIEPCLTAELTQKACRPLRCGMKMDKAIAFLGGEFRPRSVKEALANWTLDLGEGAASLGW